MSEKLQKRETSQPESTADRDWVAPRVDIYENDEEVLLLADLPGVSQDSLSIHLDKDELTLQATARQASTRSPLRGEFAPVAYRRAFLVPAGIDAERVSADLKQGVLWLHLPKSAALKPRQIQVTAG